MALFKNIIQLTNSSVVDSKMFQFLQLGIRCCKHYFPSVCGLMFLSCVLRSIYNELHKELLSCFPQ